MGFHVEKIAIIGAGLIGGSLLRAIHARHLCDKIDVYDSESADAIRQLGLKNVRIVSSGAEAVLQSDFVLLAVPVERLAFVLKECQLNLDYNHRYHSKQTIVTDVGSTKSHVCSEIDQLLKDKARFVGGHPMAGKEKSGFDASCSNLFEGATVVLTPTAFTDDEALETVYAFWEALGTKIAQMSPAEHDRRMAQISHLPHLAAAALALIPDDNSLKVAGPGFRDATRIAAGDAALWTGILSANRAETLLALDALLARLQEARAALEPGNERQLHDFLDRANEMRNKLS